VSNLQQAVHETWPSHGIQQKEISVRKKPISCCGKRRSDHIPANDPAHISSVESAVVPFLRKTGVETVQFGVHTPSVAAVMLPPDEAMAPIRIRNRSESESRGSMWFCTRSRENATEEVRRIASGKKRSVSTSLGEKACKRE
jgi:hypothetical protein